MLDYKQMTEEQLEHASEFYQREVDPLLTPITIDPGASFSPGAEQSAVPGAAAAQQAQERAPGPCWVC